MQRRVRVAFALALLGVAVWLALTDLSRG